MVFSYGLGPTLSLKRINNCKDWRSVFDTSTQTNYQLDKFGLIMWDPIHIHCGQQGFRLDYGSPKLLFLSEKHSEPMQWDSKTSNLLILVRLVCVKGCLNLCHYQSQMRLNIAKARQIFYLYMSLVEFAFSNCWKVMPKRESGDVSSMKTKLHI